MAIRLRTINGIRIALCAVESDPKPDDLYLDDADHMALAAKFGQDWQDQMVNWKEESIWEVMETQKICNAKDELNNWLNLQGIKNHQLPGLP